VQIENYHLSPKIPETEPRDVRVMQPLSPGSIERDLELTKQLIEVLNKRANIESVHQLFEERPPLLQLDIQLVYLRKVHGMCYYSST